VRIAFFGDARYIGAHEWILFLRDQPDFEVHAIVFPGHETEIPGVVTHTLAGPLPRGKSRYFACVPTLRRALSRIRPDLLVAYRVVSYGLSASFAGFHPLVMAAQGMMIASRATPRFSRMFAARALRSADLLHSWAPVMTRNMVDLGADPSRIMTLTRGIDVERFALAPEPPPPLTLVTTRQLESYYNFPTLLEAMRRVKTEIGDLRYRIAGEGSQRRPLEDLAGRLGLNGSVTFEGSVGREALPALLRSAHLYVAAVPTDGTSSSMLEAMAAGVVPIVAENESNRWWIGEPGRGKLVEAFDAAAYASAILEAWRSPEWRRRAREINREIVLERASWKVNMARFANAYRDLVRGRNPATGAIS
jgi:glycosyltransferase involved in cell wall biosynthesis